MSVQGISTKILRKFEWVEKLYKGVQVLKNKNGKNLLKVTPNNALY
jgi:hypothetical protein